MVEISLINLSKIWKELMKIKGKRHSGKEIITQHCVFLINHISRCIAKC